ncbi:MAG: pyridoxamine 5'-phosphate oxidase [Thiotrichales bacterium]|mgnify:FL=1|jgi:pyridoxamine 5'-phosphate oxidase|nr:pyridoxamine 5'-phosphate oxidase [Thiotrichales bacterium]MBT3855257.1 pyridoxamine 5'-phosphate oxidase [Thiotrichales bacterium]MBT4653391.1 pyridoxamine 5'-phosphate oxidase [Thiotrichales bacterium]MBT5499692.1 pyridoxamine 5'-phosphate oxidase [Thiotrichales bacterium]MBT5983580.1 pyridoxamine 5'-phosphate oxidase [Thiotrichales bacterium]|tara:strand:- start:1010 stop:1651 length:642 start_codon:yes stop_codon:yes gene_type:complete
MKTKGDLSSLRKEFLQSGINKEDLKSSPVEQFSLWFSQAMESDIVEPTAMSLATSDDSIGIRTVLLKYFDEKGFVFYTNYESKKSKQMQKNPQAAILFPWLALERQVKIIGKVEKISKLESLKYFSSRPKGSQIGAWASEQSSRISSRSILIEQFESMKKKFSNGEIPLPEFWGGYRVIPQSIEFWQGRANRLHDRFIYEREEGEWTISRLSP